MSPMDGDRDTTATILIVTRKLSTHSRLRTQLVEQGYQVLFQAIGDCGREHQRNRPDLILLQRLPTHTTLTTIRRLRTHSRSPIMILTSPVSVEERIAMLNSGADAVLSMPYASDELLARVHALLRRQHLEGACDALRYADLVVDRCQPVVWRGGRRIVLTQREWELLRYLVKHAREVVPRQALLDELWGADFPDGTTVLDAYIGYLRRKLEHDGEPRLIHTVRGVGYVLREAPLCR